MPDHRDETRWPGPPLAELSDEELMTLTEWVRLGAEREGGALRSSVQLAKPFLEMDPSSRQEVARAAIEEVMRRWRPRLDQYFRNAGHSPEEAEDLVMEVAIRLLEPRRAPFVPGRRFAPWLWAVAHNLSRDRLSRRRSERGQASLSSVPEPASPSTDPPSDPGEQDEVLWASLRELGEPERAFILLWNEGLGELTETQLGPVFGVNGSTITRRKQRAVRRLEQALAGRGGLRALSALRALARPTTPLGEALGACVSALPPEEQACVRLLWDRGFGCLSQTRIAALFHTSNARVSRLKQSAMEKLRQCLESKGYRLNLQGKGWGLFEKE
jgi:RNA polymerase sigma-70 factor (ECF subfamily)